MTKQDIVSLFNGLNNCGNLVGQKFGYCVARNLQILKGEVEKIEDARKALIESYAKKVDGKFVMEGNNYTFEDKESFEKEYQNLLKEEVAITLYYIKLEDVSKEVTAQQISGIYDIITSNE